ncbi:hypothetical protein [Diaphorobacter aerolatus]|uniref:Uncharacterized protein n=1 Tax=Diaphorobacter aerolatus TaxID=1288495 RepID=A0A7H0GJA9_9BURK|nr:hypothetical protein [Diaphorobacter aerolatus]QNP48375.1 hypothetical protein H9K75_20870 [Diaphorobacter aerolatus]
MNNDITNEMKKEAQSFTGYLSRMRDRIETHEAQPKTQLHPMLTTKAMDDEMRMNGLRVKPEARKGRDFFNTTQNAETLQVFNSMLNVRDIRSKYEKMDSRDVTAQHKIQDTRDLAYRNMELTHKQERQEAKEMAHLLEPQHKFEKAYFAAQESSYLNEPDAQKKYLQAHQAYKEYYADKFGISTNQQVPVEKPAYVPKINNELKVNPIVEKYKTQQEQVKSEPVVQPEQTKAIVKNIGAMRQKFGM